MMDDVFFLLPFYRMSVLNMQPDLNVSPARVAQGAGEWRELQNAAAVLSALRRARPAVRWVRRQRRA